MRYHLTWLVHSNILGLASSFFTEYNIGLVIANNIQNSHHDQYSIIVRCDILTPFPPKQISFYFTNSLDKLVYVSLLYRAIRILLCKSLLWSMQRITI